jgi:DnaJ-class molecular chaperone
MENKKLTVIYKCKMCDGKGELPFPLYKNTKCHHCLGKGGLTRKEIIDLDLELYYDL